MNKLICSDIDGTIKVVDGKFDKKIIEKIAHSDSDILLVSGRTIKEIREFGLDVDMIGSNGGEIIKNHQLILDAFFNFETAKKVILFLRENNKMVCVHTPQGKIVEAGYDAFGVAMDIATVRHTSQEEIDKTANFMFGHMYNNHRQVEDVLKTIMDENIKINKLETFFEGDKTQMSLELSSIENVDAFTSAVTNIEIVPRGVNKGHALREYVKDLDVVTFAIGDGDNDIPMFEFADVSIAVGNASDKLKAIADFVVSDVMNDGFLEALDIVENYKN